MSADAPTKAALPFYRVAFAAASNAPVMPPLLLASPLVAKTVAPRQANQGDGLMRDVLLILAALKFAGPQRQKRTAPSYVERYLRWRCPYAFIKTFTPVSYSLA